MDTFYDILHYVIDLLAPKIEIDRNNHPIAFTSLYNYLVQYKNEVQGRYIKNWNLSDLLEFKFCELQESERIFNIIYYLPKSKGYSSRLVQCNLTKKQVRVSLVGEKLRISWVSEDRYITNRPKILNCYQSWRY